MALFRLAYISTSTINGSPEDHRRELGAILLSARTNNEKAQITGALLATKDRFTQVLEGDRVAVEQTYARIAANPRHKDLTLLLAEEIQKREFPQWSMAYIDPTHTAEQAVAEVAQGLPVAGGASKLRGLLAMMADMVSEEKAPDVKTNAA
ncbi:BLUF domain-containing protein [Methyloligella sp. GL2]|nr:BLUF domain-containing protein [Methyloligella sp. GL2]